MDKELARTKMGLMDVSQFPTIADNLYSFFGNSKNSNLRQKLWNAMGASRFVETSITSVVHQNFYSANATLKKLIQNSKKPIDIVIAGNTIPTFYKKEAPRFHDDKTNGDNPISRMFPASDFRRSFQQSITIGIDHRHRPRVLANVFDPALWKKLATKKIKSIAYDHYLEHQIDQLRSAIPSNLRNKLVQLHIFGR